jgi:alkylation response protein AidB-like acyl-CoA dehydrogenase
MHAAGYAGMAWPQSYGGQGLTMREHLIVNQEIGRLAMPLSTNSLGKELVGPILLAIGSEAQKLRFIPRLLGMDDIWCQGFSEPEAGSDLAHVRTRADRTGSGWRINGQKIWTSLADRADFCLLLARTGAPEDRHGSLSLFALPMRAEGVTVRPIRQMTEAEGFCEVFLDDVALGDDALIGSVNEGWRAAVEVLSVERATNRMYRGWRFENEFRHLVRVCASEPALRHVLADPHYRQQLAASWTDIEIVKRYAIDVVQRLADGGHIGQQGSLMKLHWSEAHQRFAALAHEILGLGLAVGTPDVANARRRFEDIYLQGRAETIFAGTTEIQLGIIADRILQLPRGG